MKHNDKYYENKKKIFDCFITLINNEGYDAATISKVSRITGLSYGSITNIFNTKEDVLLEVLKVNVEAYEQVLLKSNDRMELFLSNIVKQMKRIDNDDNFKEILLDQFSLKKTTCFLKDHLASLLYNTIEDKRDCYFKAVAIVGIIREYINTDINSYIYIDKKIDNLIEDILLICKYPIDQIQFIKSRLN